MLLFPPLMQLFIFGYAANLDVNTARIAWMDQDHTPQSRALYSEQSVGCGAHVCWRCAL
jgi:ABC-2 type transport system permease protein